VCSPGFHRLAVATTAVATSLVWITPVGAQSPNEAAATALFDEGRRVMAENHYAEACPKLAESERLAPSGGTLINLADCYEHAGLTTLVTRVTARPGRGPPCRG
jgi:hypothetical protein